MSRSRARERPIVAGKKFNKSEFARFTVLRDLGSGAMGVVCLAVDNRDNNIVVIKRLRNRYTEPEDKLLFLREATTLELLNHPAIVKSWDNGDDYGIAIGAAEPNGVPFFVMDPVRGMKLSDRLYAPEFVGVPIPEEVSIEIALQIADAIGAAHEISLVYRDLNPEHVYLSYYKGTVGVKILDFGIILDLLDKEQIDWEGGIEVGTPHYMSPEQWNGTRTDHRTDIYSLGVVLYEMVVGKYIFPGDFEGLGDIMRAHRNVVPEPPHTIRPSVSERLSGIIMQALQKNKEDRQSSMGELREQLLECRRRL